MEGPIENKVAKSGLLTIDLEELKPTWLIGELDLKAGLWQEMVLREKEFRAFIESIDWSQYRQKHVYVHCSADAIIPTWAYMLVSKSLSGIAASAQVCTRDELLRSLWSTFVSTMPIDRYEDQRVILKGCSDQAIPETVYLELSARLIPIVKSLMFGEPCSTVPIYKKK
jgi:hypothetical protein